MLKLFTKNRAVGSARAPRISESEVRCEIIRAPALSLEQCARNGYLESAAGLLEDSDVVTEINTEDDEGLTPLHYAARYNHFEVVKLLIKHGANVNAEDNEGLTPLHYACRIKRKRKKSRKSKMMLLDDDDNPLSPQTPSPQKRLDIDPDAKAIHYLIEKGAAILHKDEFGCTPLHHAALRGDEVACEQILMYKSNDQDFIDSLVNAIDNQRMTPLHTAACQCEPDIARQLLRAGADVYKVDEELSTPLHEAATAGDTRIAKMIFESCSQGDALDNRRLTDLLATKDEDGNTPLMLAVESARYKFVVNCINKGASLNSLNKWHMSALHLAAIKGDEKIVRLLLENGARVSALNYEHQTPLHKAALFNNTTAMEMLLDNGANINAKDQDDFTPLLLAACYGHPDATEKLIKRGADVTVEDKNDRTAVYLAAEEDKLETLQVLLKYSKLKDQINDRDENSNSALHAAAGLGHIRIVKCLLDHGADLYVKNDLEQTPIHMAALNGWTNVVSEIVQREKNAMSDGDEDSNTALHLAATGGHIKLVSLLLNLGAEPEVRNSTLRTAIGCAAASGYHKTVKLLAAFDAQIDPIDKQKLTPLLAAASNGHSEVVEFLLEKNADVSICDLDGNNCLDLAIEHEHTDVALEIIKSKAWKSALRNTTSEKGWVNTPMRKLIRKMPEVACEVFNKCIEVHKPEEGSQHKLMVKPEVQYDFEFIDDLYCIPAWETMPKRKKKDNAIEVVDNSAGTKLVPYTRESETFKKNHPLMIMVDSSREELLNHPLILSLIDYKWQSFGRILFYLSFAIYVFFVFCLTIYVGLTKAPFTIDKSNFGSYEGDNDCQKYEASGEKHHILAVITKYFILVLAFINCLKEVVQGIHLRLFYIQSGENWFEITLYVTSVLFTLDFESCQNVTGYRTDWQWNVGSVAIVLAWTNLVLFIQKFPALGIYVVMFKSIFLTFLKFYLVFQMFVIAFGMGFYCLLQNQTPFSNPWYSVLRTAVMMIGEFDYTDIFFGDDELHYWLSFIMFAVFVVVMPIIIMNLLVGLAVDDIKGVQEQAALKRIAMKVHSVLDTERASLSFTSRYFKERYSNKFHSMEEAVAATKESEEFENQIQKSQMKVLKKMDKIKHGMKSMKGDMVKMEEMLEAILKAQNIKLGQDES